MNRELLHAWLRIAVFFTLASAFLIPFQAPDSAEQVISITTMMMGMIFVAVIAWRIWRSKP